MVDSINPINANPLFLTPQEEKTTSPAFNPPVPTISGLERIPTEDSFEYEEEPNHMWRNIGLGTLASVGLAIGADYLFAKGKHVKKFFSKFKSEKKETPKPNDKPKEIEIKKSDERIRLEEINKDSGEVLNGNTVFDSNGKKLRTIEKTAKDETLITVYNKDGALAEKYLFNKDKTNVTKYDNLGREVSNSKKDLEGSLVSETTHGYSASGSLVNTVETDFENNVKKTTVYNQKRLYKETVTTITDTKGVKTSSSRVRDYGFKRIETNYIVKDGRDVKNSVLKYDANGNLVRKEILNDSGVVIRTTYTPEGTVLKEKECKGFKRFF